MDSCLFFRANTQKWNKQKINRLIIQDDSCTRIDFLESKRKLLAFSRERWWFSSFLFSYSRNTQKKNIVYQLILGLRTQEHYWIHWNRLTTLITTTTIISHWMADRRRSIIWFLRSITFIWRWIGTSCMSSIPIFVVRRSAIWLGDRAF